MTALHSRSLRLPVFLHRMHVSLRFQPVRVRLLLLLMREDGSWSATEAAVEAQRQRLQARRWRK